MNMIASFFIHMWALKFLSLTTGTKILLLRFYTATFKVIMCLLMCCYFLWYTIRYETTGIRPEYLRDAMPLKQVQRKIQDFLCNGEPVWKIRSRGGKARILVGHGLDHDLESLGMEYPSIMIRYTSILSTTPFIYKS